MEIKLTPELWSTIIEIEKLLDIERQEDEYRRAKTLLNIVFAKLLAYDLVYSKLKLDVQTTIRLLELTDNREKHLTHFVRDELGIALKAELSAKLREYDRSLEVCESDPWNEISF